MAVPRAGGRTAAAPVPRSACRTSSRLARPAPAGRSPPTVVAVPAGYNWRRINHEFRDPTRDALHPSSADGEHPQGLCFHEPSLRAARAARRRARGRRRRRLPAGGAGLAQRPRRSRGRLAGRAALRVPGRRAVARVRVRAQRGLPRGRPRQRGAVAVSDRRLREPRRLRRRPRDPRPAALHPARAGPRDRTARHLRAPRPEGGASQPPGRPARRDHRLARAGVRAAAGRRRFQRLEPAGASAHRTRAADCARSSSPPTGARRARFRRAFRCSRSTASTSATSRAHAPLALPRRPWSTLSDHAPLAAEVTL